MTALSLEALQERIAESELGREWSDDLVMKQEVWSLTELGYSEEECRMITCRHIYFDAFSLPWLKLLTKLTAKATARERLSLSLVIIRVNCLKHLDQFLMRRGYTQPQSLTDSLLQEFIAQVNSGHRQATIIYAVNLWAEEGWLQVSFVPRKYKKTVPKIETIPEEVLFQVYDKFDLFPLPIERLFRLQLVLGCRIGERLNMPRHCLKQENEQWFLLRWVAKRKHWRFYQIHPLVAELVQEQQRFLNTQFGCNSDFEKLFCQTFFRRKDIQAGKGRFQAEPSYLPKLFSKSVIQDWLRYFSEEADLKDKHGNKFYLVSHMFRRTKASIMAYCEAEDEYIAAVLGHGSLDMLPYYRQRSLERLEKEATAKGYVDMYGRLTSFKPRKRRYDRLANLLKVSTPLGECHRPTMLGDCQYRYACLSCTYHRVTLEDKIKLEADYFYLQQDLEQARNTGQERRIIEINRLLTLLKSRLQGLEELENFKEGQG